LAVATATEVPLYSGYAYPSVYSAGLTYTYPSPPLAYNYQAKPEDVEKVFDLTANFIKTLKDNSNTGFTYTYPTGYYPQMAYNYQANLGDVEKVFDLTSNFINKLKDNPGTEIETTVKTKRSPVVPVAYYANPYNTVPLTEAPSDDMIKDIEEIFGSITNLIAELKAKIPTGAIPANQAKEAQIEQLEAVFGVVSKLIADLKAKYPAATIPSGAIPTYPGAAPVNYQANEAVSSLIKKFTSQLLSDNAVSAIPTYPGAAPANYQANEAVNSLIKKITSQLLADNAAPIESTPSTYVAQLIDTSCKNSLGFGVPCALRRKRSPQEAVAAPIAYNAAPLTYVGQPLTYTYPVVTPITYNAYDLGDIEKVFDLTAKFIKKL